jgi:hypothetical protein
MARPLLGCFAIYAGTVVRFLFLGFRYVTRRQTSPNHIICNFANFARLAFVFTRKRYAVLEIIYISWLGLEFCINLIAFIVLIPRVLMPYIFEPTGVINEDWAWLWSGLVFYFVFSAFAMAICLGKSSFYDIKG